MKLIQSPDNNNQTSASDFNDLAIRLFQHQFDHHPLYQKFVLGQGVVPHQIHRWEEIPPLPVLAFRLANMALRPLNEAKRVFHSSGTTAAERSQHPLFDLDLAETAILSHFHRHLLPNQDKIQMAILTPSPTEAPHSSLSYMMETVRQAHGSSGSHYYIERGHLQSERLAYDLAEATAPVCLCGTSFSFVHFIDFYERHAIPCQLPPGSRLMDTGGFKGKSREVSREWIYAKAGALFGISPENCVNEYGMVEMTSQFYDSVAGKPIERDLPRVYIAPPQVRTRILSLETLQPVERGEIGLLAHYDLANIDAIAAILTEDIGWEVPGGFVLLGRAPGAAVKGCSLTVDEMLSENPSFELNLPKQK